jgi:predicted nucleic acid-binding Zn ribbon protein
MNKEISEKIEYERNEIKEESIRLRQIAKEKHVCPNCGKSVSGNRLYCSNDCAYIFFKNYDYSKNSEKLRNYKNLLMEENKKPKKEVEPWSYPVARKTYKCFVCGLDITSGQKYVKYTRIPGEEGFDEEPYGVTRYHESCMDFLNVCVDNGYISSEGFEKREIKGILYVLAIESNHGFAEIKEMVRDGKFSDKETLENLIGTSGYEEDGFAVDTIYGDGDIHAVYVYLVETKVQNFDIKTIYEVWHEVEDPEEYFKNECIERTGDICNGILSIKKLKVPVVELGIEDNHPIF